MDDGVDNFSDDLLMTSDDLADDDFSANGLGDFLAVSDCSRCCCYNCHGFTAIDFFDGDDTTRLGVSPPSNAVNGNVTTGDRAM